MKIGVFDSGIGGEAVAAELQARIEGAAVITVNDHAHVPYGGRSQQEVIELTDAAIQPLLREQCDCIVIACNTATVNAIATLRERYPTQKFVGLEPMLKPAWQLSKTRNVAVLATPATLQSRRYAELKEEWSQDLTIFEPNCTSWAALIEAGKASEIPLGETLAPLIERDVDVIVLACTHYHWLKHDIQSIVGTAVIVLEPSQAIRRRILSIVA